MTTSFSNHQRQEKTLQCLNFETISHSTAKAWITKKFPCENPCDASLQSVRNHTRKATYNNNGFSMDYFCLSIPGPTIYKVYYTGCISIFRKKILIISSSPGQNGHHFADNIFRCIFMIEIFYILKFVPKGQIDKKPSIGLDNGLALNRWQAIIWTTANLIHWCIYAALGGNELI